MKGLFVLHINTAKSWRGGEQQVLYLALSLKERGIGQILVCPPGSELEKRARAAGIPVECVPMRGEFDLLAARRIGRIAREYGATILHAHTARAHTLGLLARKFFAAPSLVVSRRVDFPARQNFLSRRKYESPLVEFYIAISKNVERILIQDGIPPEKIRIAYSGIDPERFSRLPDPVRLRNDLGISDGEVVLGNVAALVDHKDQRTLLGAFARLLERLQEERRERKTVGSKTGSTRELNSSYSLRLIIVGEGKLRAELEALAESLGLLKERRVLFTGFRSDIPSFLALFDVFVMSSREEGLGTSVLDAMAAGLPVCATSAGGIPEMVDPEKGGLLSPAGDADGMAVNLKRLVDSPALRRKMGDYNRKRVMDFSRQATCESTLAVYREVLEALRV